jgi:hypothetical protein
MRLGDLDALYAKMEEEKTELEVSEEFVKGFTYAMGMVKKYPKFGAEIYAPTDGGCGWVD